ncbi:MAG: hypothetical protein Q8922_10115 [Bacteroidota bacterium]|nr:hypothetical protein [Bacteroidota bacterium]MDP4232409.1 hypothetical protein [Bacteroidota bacterium]MDP4241545.1 hypothetical protein [Bacteroidota bacterium]MDP4288279.1 hypothetical protein [Bacteroidota bacterium]
MKTILILLLLAPLAAQAQRVHTASIPRAGDTVFPGSPAWIHAGSPHNTLTGDSITLIWGADGALHPLGYAIEDVDGSWVVNTLANREVVEEKTRLMAAARLIMQEMPDRKILRPVNTGTVSIARNDTGYDPYKEVMQWVDSIARVYNAPYFRQRMYDNYRTGHGGLEPTPYDHPRYDS